MGSGSKWRLGLCCSHLCWQLSAAFHPCVLLSSVAEMPLPLQLLPRPPVGQHGHILHCFRAEGSDRSPFLLLVW